MLVGGKGRAGVRDGVCGLEGTQRLQTRHGGWESRARSLGCAGAHGRGGVSCRVLNGARGGVACPPGRTLHGISFHPKGAEGSVQGGDTSQFKFKKRSTRGGDWGWEGCRPGGRCPGRGGGGRRRGRRETGSAVSGGILMKRGRGLGFLIARRGGGDVID